MTTPTPPPPTVLSFIAPINPQTGQGFRNALLGAVNEGLKEIEILISSSGGSVDEGIALYELIKSVPIKTTFTNIGSIDSIALLVYLAADVRYARSNATFLFHDYTWTFNSNIVPRPQIKEILLLLEAAQKRVRTALEERTKISNGKIGELDVFENTFIMDANTALENGIIHKITDHKVPVGMRMFNITY
jgi:ATP-dependent protease ClpP protease subunit